METRGLHAVIRHVRRVALLSSSDEDLLLALMTQRDEDAFEVLLRRHGPMVWAACRRVLRNPQDAEDAFQATFMVLLRKAATIRNQVSIASWLYGVAYRTASKAQAMNVRRRIHEGRVASRPRQELAEEFPELDRELSALPEKYRLPVVLCELQGRTRNEVARMLKIPEGTLSSRLAMARKTLAKRLRSHGFTFSVYLATPSSVPSPLVSSTVHAGAALISGYGAAGILSANVLVLTRGVMNSMLIMKLKTGVGALLILGSLTLGAEQLALHAQSDGPVQAGNQARTSGTKPDQNDPGLKEAKLALQRAEAELEAAQAKLALRKGLYDATLARANQALQDKTMAACYGAIASRFKYRIPVELGKTTSSVGAHIEILEIWGTRPQIAIGGQYLVRGKYALTSHNWGRIYLYVTSEGDWNNSGPNLDLQSADAVHGEGEFTLIHGLGGAGSFHVQMLYEGGMEPKSLANVYFK